MRIDKSDVTLSSSQINYQESTRYERFHAWDKDESVLLESFNHQERLTSLESLQRDTFEKVNENASNQPPGLDLKRDKIKKLMTEVIGDLRARIMKAVIEQMTGKEIKTFDQSELTDPQPIENPASELPPADAQNPGASQATPDQPQRQGWGIDYYLNERSYSKEGFSFNASGTVTTQDGRQLKFNASLEITRERFEELTVSYKAGDALIDPIIVDFSGTGVKFSDSTFEFDLDGNGTLEQLFTPHQGAGFLAYDKNGNGLIDDGTELFGPSSGQGFTELAALDDDKNGWVDENDKAFSALKVLEIGADGTNSISGLLQKDIGALYTGKASTAFNIETGNNLSGTLAAVLKESGVYLKESGGTGFLQEVDMVA